MSINSIHPDSYYAWHIRKQLIEKYGKQEVEKRLGIWKGADYENKENYERETQERIQD